MTILQRIWIVTVQPPELVEGGHSASTSSADGGEWTLTAALSG